MGMRHRRGVGLVAVAVSVAVAATVSAYAAPAASTRGREGSRVLDSTYSCRVRTQHYVDVATSVTLAPVQGMQRPAEVWLDTAGKTSGTKAIPQVYFQAAKISLKVDKSACRASSRRVPLKPGLPLYQTVTPSFFGSINVRCTVTRVLVRLRIEMKGGTPAQALVAIRNDNHKASPVAFLNWSPRKIKGYIGGSCIDTG